MQDVVVEVCASRIDLLLPAADCVAGLAAKLAAKTAETRTIIAPRTTASRSNMEASIARADRQRNAPAAHSYPCLSRRPPVIVF